MFCSHPLTRSNFRGAGTDCDVYCKLIGLEGELFDSVYSLSFVLCAQRTGGPKGQLCAFSSLGSLSVLAQAPLATCVWTTPRTTWSQACATASWSVLRMWVPCRE